MLRKLVKKGKMFLSGISNLEIYEYGRISDGPYIEKMINGKFV
jgi:hypothetical protein